MKPILVMGDPIWVPERVMERFLRRRRNGFICTHCSSCHSEQEYRWENGGDIDLPHEIDLGKGRIADVCCDVAASWEAYTHECNA